MKNVFLFGYYGFENTGDEAILEAIIQQFRQVLPEVRLTVLTYKAKETMAKYGVETVSRNGFREILRAIRRSDLVVSGGGSLLQDVTSSRSLLYYLAIIFLAKKMGKQVMFYGNGFGPITGWVNQRLVPYILNQVDLITVRDYQSKEAMRSLGIRKEVTVTADVAFALDLPAEEEIDRLWQEAGLTTERKVIGVSVRRWQEEQYKEVLATTCDSLIKDGYEVLFIPMQYPEDLKISQEIAGLMKKQPRLLETRYTAKELIGLISRLHLLMGMRLHALVFSAIGGVPMVGLEYDPKIQSFLGQVGQKSGGKVERLDLIHLWATVEEVVKSREGYRQALLKSRNQLREKSQQNILILERFFNQRKEQG